MNKRLSLYQIFMVAMTTIIAAMLVAMGVIAINKSMTLKLGLKMDPAMLCAIYVNDNLVFNNKTSEIASGVSLSANELRLNSTNTFGAYFNLKIENLNEFAINISLSGCTVGEVEGYETAILPKKDTGNIEISSAGLITITMTEAEVYYVQYNANNGGGEMATSTHIVGASSALSANAFTAPSEDVEFAGWATTLTDAQNGVVTYEEGQVILNLGTTDGQTIQLYAVWKMKGYKVTFATNNWAATYKGEQVTSPLVVEPNGNLTVTVAGSGTQEGYSVHTSPTITGTITSSTFDRYTGTLTLTNIQSDLTISATDFRPWTYGKYVSTYTSDTEPAIGTIVSGTDVYYPAFNGYKYVIFANHETQENNFYISTPGDMAARWIMIGAGESVSNEIMLSAVMNTTVSPYAFKGNVNEIQGKNDELENNEVLLLSECVLKSTIKLALDEECGWSGNLSTVSGVTLRMYLNENFLQLSGISLYNTCISKKDIITYWNGSSDLAENQSMFILADSERLTNNNQNYEFGTYLGGSSSDNLQNYSFKCQNTGDLSWPLRSCGYDEGFGGYMIYGLSVNGGAGALDTSMHNYYANFRPTFVLNLA